MKKILVTAFEPFGGRSVNPALEVMKKLSPSSFPGARLFRAKLPVAGSAVGPKIAALVGRLKPDLVVSLGLAAGEAGLRVERFAVNVQDYPIKDNSGRKPEGTKIIPAGPAAYCVTADPLRLAAAARRAGLPAYVSNHAGAYVCNNLMYEALAALETAGGARYAFLHLPLTTEMALAEGGKPQPSLPLALLVKGVTAAVKAA